MFGQQNSPFGGSGGFGQQQQQQQQGGFQNPQGGFGSTPTPFGQPQQQQPAAPFGTPAPAGGFGGQQQPQSNFAAPSPFGGGTAGPFGQPQQQQQQQQQQSAFGSSAFGSASPAPAGGSLFGGSQNAGFGSTAPAFGSSPGPAPNSSLFGNNTATTPNQQQGSTLFSNSTSTSSPFSSFGSTPAATGNAFGSGSTFGSTATTPGQNSFAAQAPAPGMFGTKASTAVPFGAPTPAPGGLFGAPAPSSLFGQPQQQQQQQQGQAGQGTRHTQFQVTSKQDGNTNISLQSITAMQQYDRYSFEELRLQDYLQGNRGSSTPQASNATGSFFGGTQTNTFAGTTPSQGTFGATNTTPALGGTLGSFGSPAAAPTPGIFGASNTPAAAPFAAPGAPSTGLFAPAASPGTSTFGSSQATTNSFGGIGAPAGGTTFGTTNTPTSGSLFGGAGSTTSAFGTPAPAPTTGFGAAPAPGAPSLFNSTPGGGFGAAPAPSAFGSSFGAPAAQQSTSLFGTPAAAPAFGTQGQPFGSQQSGGLFGGAPTTGFGAQAQTTPGTAAPFGAPQATPFGPAAPATPPAVPPNANIIPQVHNAVLEQQLKALDEQKRELERTEVWRSGTSSSAASPSSPANLSGANGLVPGRMSYSAYSTASTPRSAVKIRPRGFPKTEPAKSKRPEVIGFGRDNGATRTPESHLRSSVTQLVIRPESLTKKPLRLQLRMDRDNDEKTNSPSLPDETISPLPREDPASSRSSSERHAALPSRQSETTPEVDAHETAKTPATTPDSLVNSPGYDYYQKVIGSGKDRGSHPYTPAASQSKSARVPKLTKPGYEVSPSIEDMSRMTEADLAAVENFSVTRPSFGKVEWSGAVDVRSADLDAIVEIEQNDISVYAREEEEGTKPAEGAKLNRPAVLTFYNLFPKEGKNASEESRDKLHRKLERSARKAGAEFLSYDSVTGVWTIQVQHFSRYAANLDEDSDADEGMSPQYSRRVQIQSPDMLSNDARLPLKRKATPFRTTHVSIRNIEEDASEASDSESGAILVDDMEITEVDVRDAVRASAEEAFLAVFENIRGEPGLDMDTQNYDRKEAAPFDLDGEDCRKRSGRPRMCPDSSICDQALTEGSLRARFGSGVDAHQSFDVRTPGLARFRVGWLPDGSFLKMGAGSSGMKTLVKCRPVFSPGTSVASPVDLLQVHQQYAESAQDVDACPEFAFPRGLENGGSITSNEFLHSATMEFSVKILKNQDATATFSMLSSLLRVDNSRHSELGLRRAKPFPEDSRRTAAVSFLLKSICSFDVEKDIQEAKQRHSPQSAVLAAISSGDVERACDVAAEYGLLSLAAMLSTGMRGRDDGRKQILQSMKTSEFSKMPREMLRSLNRVGGGTADEDNSIRSLDWRRRLALRILREPDAALPDVLRCYDADVESGKAPLPISRHSDATGDGTDRSTLYRAMVCLSNPESVALSRVVDPSGFTPSEHDFSVSFHLAASFSSALSAARLTVWEEERLKNGYEAQLVSVDLWEWAVFVSLCALGPVRRDVRLAKVARAKEYVQRLYDPLSSRAEERRTFLEKLGIPTTWFEEALTDFYAYHGQTDAALASLARVDSAAAAKAYDEQFLPGKFFLVGEDALGMATSFALDEESLATALLQLNTLSGHVERVSKMPLEERAKAKSAFLADTTRIEKIVRAHLAKPDLPWVLQRMVPAKSPARKECLVDILDRLGDIEAAVLALPSPPPQ